MGLGYHAPPGGKKVLRFLSITLSNTKFVNVTTTLEFENDFGIVGMFVDV